jgi:hypothetical protein
MTMTRTSGCAGLARDAWRSESGATLTAYLIVTGAIALVCIGAVTYLNFSTERRIQARAEQGVKLSSNQGSDASLGSEVAKSTAVLGGIELPFQFGIPLFAMPSRKKTEKAPEEETRSASCPGGKCAPGESTCFVAGTLVLTPTGYRKIEDIRVGDEVLSIPEDSPWATAEVGGEGAESGEDDEPLTGSAAVEAPPVSGGGAPLSTPR